MHKRSGFTIIELVVVVGIIGVLASLAVVSFSKAQMRARDMKRVSDIHAVVSGFKSALAASKGEQIVLCTKEGAAIGSSPAAATPLENVKGCKGIDGSCSAECENVLTEHITLEKVIDPMSPIAVCTGSFEGSCQYSIFGTPGMADQFTIQFNTEQSDVIDLSPTLMHVATQNSIK